MGTVIFIDDYRAAGGERRPRPPALRVHLTTGGPEDAALGVVSVRIRVTGARLPVRVYLYVDGDLAEAWTETQVEHDLRGEDYEPGRHAVTARAVDALGRWAGASIIVESTLPSAQPLPGA
ncbi:MAG TPA: hypothetical protein VNN07_15025 [Candidatus Tectomicrobia bacterium]|nr:hypothetical protein [Candidatus Tectomicrobia bacterium]